MNKLRKTNPFIYLYVLWALVFIIAPLLLVLGHSVTTAVDGTISFTMEHFLRVFEPQYMDVIVRSIRIAVITTIACLVLGYPVAMFLAERGVGRRNILVMMIILPMWMNFLARTYAWMALLDKNGLINQGLAFLGLPTFDIMYTELAVILGMIYNFLPFMILPIYSVLVKLDRNLIYAAQDLGASPFTVFRKVTLPLSMSGVITGITMVFMPSVTTFVISKFLGGGKVNMVGNLIETQFLTSNNWGFGSALCIVIMVMILISMVFMAKSDRNDEGRGLF